MLQEMVRSSTIGFPRIGPRRELKKALEGYWSGRVSAADLAAEARALRQANWEFQRRAGIDHIPSGDFSLYDHVLDAAVMIGAVPGRYREGRHGRLDPTSPWPEVVVGWCRRDGHGNDQVVRHQLPLPGP